ncbi:MAG: signal peptidase I [Oscillospiraceae bacterium]|nr:signal peptidase I [Oscillospiraceae bacterium]
MEEQKVKKVKNKEEKSKVQMDLYDWVQCLFSALICGILIFIFIGRSIGVVGRSMESTLKDTDRVIMRSLFYEPQNGDIVVFQSTNVDRFNNIPLVKRVIATEGQSVDINFDTSEVFVDGELVDEPYTYTMTTNRDGFQGPVIVKEGHVFVMGDNRAASIDSRSADVGQIDTRHILGKVLFILIPGESRTEPRDWSRFGVVR